MFKRILALVMAALLMAAFYVYALLREDEETKGREEWLVTAEEQPFEAFGGMQSQDPAQLVQAMGMALPLPNTLQTGEVRDSRYHAAYARLLHATDGTLTVRGVRPASASPLIRPAGLSFETTGHTLHSYPLLRAQDGTTQYYYLAIGQQGAFVISLPQSLGEAGLAAITLYQPE